MDPVLRSQYSPPPADEVGRVWERARAMRGYVERQTLRDECDASCLAEAAAASQSFQSSDRLSAGSASADGHHNSTRHKQDRIREQHHQGNCKPCGYFALVGAGCPNGNDCDFCHMCDNVKYKAWKRRTSRGGPPGDTAANDDTGQEAGEDEAAVAFRWQ
eukprot:TRINITY_DN60643_c0_g1_i1.p2 TRINITY_DN60643_c0_g1~~TRINITY_DN60643_c0_g1_i1.p2  ORF type:complete len:160 (-),score=14.16 TRINITY_DN60643_c0_g1_i1:453-932(-)